MGRVSRDERLRRQEDAKRCLAHHVVRPDQVKSWRFHRMEPKVAATLHREGDYPFAKSRLVETASFQRSSPYWFTLTWTPGHLTLTGDCGELTLVHYHALSTVRDIAWALAGDFDYLLEKTSAKRTYQADETRAYVLAEMNRGVLELLREERDERREFRKQQAVGLETFKAAHAEWVITGEGDEPEVEWYVEEAFDDSGYRFRRKEATWSPRQTINEAWDIPDGWSMWAHAGQHSQGYYGSDAFFQPDEVTKGSVRQRVWNDIETDFGEAHTAADLLHKIGFDDFHGCYEYDSHLYFQLAVIQYGIRMILDGEAKAE